MDSVKTDGRRMSPLVGAGKLLNFLRENFNIDNSSLNQFPVLNGVFLFGPDAVKVFTQSAQYVDTNNLWQKLRLSLSSDFLVPMVMGNTYDEYREAEVSQYVRKRVEWKDMIGTGLASVQTEVKALYDFLYSICGKNIRVNSFLPYSRSEFFARVSGPNAQDEVERYKKVVDTKNAAMTGGLDFSGTREILNLGIQGQDSTKTIVTPLQSFEGFQFKVIEYQPILNPVEFFLGALNQESHPT